MKDRYVAVDRLGGVLQSSDRGVWNKISIPGTNPQEIWPCLAYAHDRAILKTWGRSVMAVSDDGIQWKAKKNPEASFHLSDLAWDGHQFIGGGNGTGRRDSVQVYGKTIFVGSHAILTIPDINHIEPVVVPSQEIPWY